MSLANFHQIISASASIQRDVILFIYRLSVVIWKTKVIMNIEEIVDAAQKPEIYTPGTAVMWVDEYISTQLLEVHLNQEVELASRKKTTISSTVDWILGKVPGDRMSILDLGCGPGLYTEKLAHYGHFVTGMDFSSNSIQYAKESSSKKKLNINYVQQDYLEMKEEYRYDLILLIFTDFGVLVPDQRKSLLSSIYRALKPGGTFVFDVLNEKSDVVSSSTKNWEVVEKGFWRKQPHLALTESFHYEKQNVTLNQHIVIDEERGMEVYRFWTHSFSDIELRGIISSAGFNTVECFDNVIPDSDIYHSKAVTFCIAKK